MGEVAGLPHRGEIEVGEIVLEPVGPLDLEHAVTLTPPHAGGCLYLWKLGRAIAHEVYPRLVGADVPVETTLQVARPHEVVHPGVEVPIEETWRMRPAVEEVTEVGLAGLAVLAHQGGGPGLLVEGLVPDLVYATGVSPAPPDPRVRTIEKEQPPQTLRVLPGEPLRHVSSYVVADDPEPLEAQRVSEAAQILHEVAQKLLRGIGQPRLFCVAEAPQVGGDHVEALGKRRDILVPRVPELRPPVQQYEGESLAVADVVNSDPVRLQTLMV